MIDEGYAATQILSQFHDVVIEEKLGDKQKSVITEKMAVSANTVYAPNTYRVDSFFKIIKRRCDHLLVNPKIRLDSDILS